MKPIISFLETTRLARKQVHCNLTLFPLLAPNGIKPDYLTLDQALDKNLVKITELDDASRVPELKLINFGKKKILIIEAEELVGAKQNRIINSSFLIAGKARFIIPVSCVEQGRWSYESDEFESGKNIIPTFIRRNHQQDVSYSLKHGDGYLSNQGRIWDGIAEKSVRMKVAAPTGAIADVFESYEDKLSEFIDKFNLIELQAGAIFAINGQVLGLECFGCHDTFKRFFNKLVKSYALDALDSPKGQSKSVPPDKARRFISSVIKSKGETYPSLGLGKNITFESRSISGAALVERNRVFHLSAFKKEGKGNPIRLRYKRYSQRRNLR